MSRHKVRHACLVVSDEALFLFFTANGRSQGGQEAPEDASPEKKEAEGAHYSAITAINGCAKG